MAKEVGMGMIVGYIAGSGLSASVVSSACRSLLLKAPALRGIYMAVVPASLQVASFYIIHL